MSPTLRFVPAMYAAALSGRKTQTRRVITPQPSGLIDSWHLHERNKDTVSFFATDTTCLAVCPVTYGPPGTTLPIVTTWAAPKALDAQPPLKIGWGLLEDHGPTDTVQDSLWFNDGTEKPDWAGKSRPAMFFPKSLYHLARQARVTAVKAERVKLISEEDAIAEGAQRNDAPDEEWDGTYLTQRYINGLEGSQDDEPHGSAKEWYREIWDSINATRGKGESKGCYAWNKNPWVFATTFELV